MRVPDEGVTREQSWSGSEGHRRPQGTVEPPKRAPTVEARFTIPAGTRCQISRVSPLKWSQYVTRKAIGFEKYEQSKGFRVIFREGFYLINVAWSLVKRRR